jgi:hypothetical protein
MATINATVEFPERKPSSSNWVRFKRWIVDFCVKHTICGSAEEFSELECYRTDQHVRKCVRAEMREHNGFGGKDSCVSNAIDEVLTETGYDLSDIGTIRAANKNVKRTMSDWDQYFKDIGVDPLCIGGGRVKIIPKFAAACALHIRAKLGALPNNEANYLLVQRKYLEVCRRHGVRDADTVLHQGFVMNAVFTESVLDDIASSRKRLPAWLRFLEDVPKTGAVPASIC